MSHVEQRQQLYPQPRAVADMRQMILSSAAVQAAIKAEAARAATNKSKPSKSNKGGPAPSAFEVVTVPSHFYIFLIVVLI